MATIDLQPAILPSPFEKQQQTRAFARRTTRPWMMTGALVACTALGSLNARPAFARTVEAVKNQDISLELWLDRRFPLGSVPSAPALPMRQDVTSHSTAARRIVARGHRRGQDLGLRRYDIPAGPLETAIAAYQSASGVTVTFPADLVRGITSPGVSGMFTRRAGARASCCAGTSLAFRFTAPFAAVVEIRIASESVEVTAPARGSRRRSSPSRCATRRRRSP